MRVLRLAHKYDIGLVITETVPALIQAHKGTTPSAMLATRTLELLELGYDTEQSVLVETSVTALKDRLQQVRKLRTFACMHGVCRVLGQ